MAVDPDVLTITDDLETRLAALESNGGDRGIVYVAADGSDGNAGRSWTLPKLSIAGAQAAGGNEALILAGQGSFDVNESIECVDGQMIEGISPHASFGTVLQATATLGTDPLLKNAAGNLTSGGFQNLLIQGTDDGDGGVGLHITDGPVTDGWFIDRVRVQKFTSHGIHIDLSSGVAGNPLMWGVLDCFANGAGGSGDGFRLERPMAGTVRIAYLGGDDNAGSLLHIELMNDQGLVRIDNLKAERTIDGKHNNIVTVDNSSGILSIGGFRIYHNVTGGSNANALIRELTSKALRFHVDGVFSTEAGAQTFDYGFSDGVNTVPFADFIRRPWFWNTAGIGLKKGLSLLTGAGSPEGVVAARVGSQFLREDGGAGTTQWIKESGSGNTGWAAK